MCVTKTEKMEKALNLWIENQTYKNITLSGQIISEKAKGLYKHFEHSNGEGTVVSQSISFAYKEWLDKFKKQDSLHNVKLVGESASPDLKKKRLSSGAS